MHILRVSCCPSHTDLVHYIHLHPLLYPTRIFLLNLCCYDIDYLSILINSFHSLLYANLQPILTQMPVFKALAYHLLALLFG